MNKAPDEKSSALELAVFINKIIINGDTMVNDSKISHPNELKERWGDFITLVYAARNDPERVNSRKQNAFNLYAEIKVQNIVLREFAYHLQNPNTDSEENKEQFSQIFGDKNGFFKPDSVIRIAKGDYHLAKTDKLLFSMTKEYLSDIQ